MTDFSTLEVLRGNSVFTKNLYQLLSMKEGNVFFSPIGVHICLSMIYQGAQKTTADVLSKILKLPSAELTAKGYKAIIEKLNSIEKITLLMANKIYAKESKKNPVVFIEEFRKRIIEDFYGDLEFVNFEKKKETIDMMNAWIEEKTQKKIQNMLREDFVDEDTAMILISALYFKGLWSKKFRESSTNDQTFYVDDENTVEVKMMHNTACYLYKLNEELEAKILKLPYEGDNVSMIIILPLFKNGIKKLESKLVLKDIIQLTQDLRMREVVVSLPKFKVEETINLKSILVEMGLQNVFDQREANFGKIMNLSPDENLYVDKVLQKSFIEVNEEGTEAAAATVVRMERARCAIEDVYEYFKVDHPAIFILVAQHDSEMNILFCGRLSCPKY